MARQSLSLTIELSPDRALWIELTQHGDNIPMGQVFNLRNPVSWQESTLFRTWPQLGNSQGGEAEPGKLGDSLCCSLITEALPRSTGRKSREQSGEDRWAQQESCSTSLAGWPGFGSKYLSH